MAVQRLRDSDWSEAKRASVATPDTRHRRSTEAHSKAAAYLGYALAQGEGVIVITGETSAEKSLLSAHLLETADRDRLDIVRIGSAAPDGGSLLQVIAERLHGNVDGLPCDQLKAIERTLRVASHGGRRTLLIVDDAHALSLTMLEQVRALSELQAGRAALLQVALVGRPELRDRLQDSPELERLRQRIIAMQHLEPAQARPAGESPARITLVSTREPPAPQPLATASRSRSGNFAELERLLAGLEKRLAQTPSEPTTDPATERRIAELEQRVEEQQEALRRVLMLLIRWVEARETRHSSG